MPYAVAIGRQRKVVDTWKECKELTHEFPRAKFKKVYDEEEGLDFIERTLNADVLELGYEFKQFSIKSNIPHSYNKPNVTITLRVDSYIKEEFPLRTPAFKIYCIVNTDKKLGLPLDESDQSRYLFTREFSAIGESKNTAMIIFLIDLFRLVRKTEGDTSILLNVDSNYIIELLKSRIDFQYEITTDSKIYNYKEILELYDETSILEGLIMNYEDGSFMSKEGVYLDSIRGDKNKQRTR